VYEWGGHQRRRPRQQPGVLRGLAAGDKVIVSGVQKVFMPGMPVQAKPVALATTSPAAARKAVALD
jgi:multidrug efflux system membrane fusion protein